MPNPSDGPPGKPTSVLPAPSGFPYKGIRVHPDHGLRPEKKKIFPKIVPVPSSNPGGRPDRDEKMARKETMSKKRPNQKEFAHIGGVLTDVMGGFRKRPEGDLTELWNQWNAAVGPAVAENTRPAAVKGRLLTVNVASSAWLQQLQFLKADLIARLNRALGEQRVEDIRFRVGPVGP